MLKGFPGSQESRDEGSDKISDDEILGNLDLLNLRLRLPSNNAAHRKRRGTQVFPNSQPYKGLSRGSGDGIKYHRHPLENEAASLQVPNISNLPKGYGNCRPPSAPPSFNPLYRKESSPRIVLSPKIKKDDFIFPHHTNPPSKPIVQLLEERMSKSLSRHMKENSDRFPFRVTPSGNLKVESSQVVFSSNKFSVLVADPKNTKVNIEPQQKFKMSKDPSILQRNSAIDTIISQAGLSFGEIMGQAPDRGEPEDAEYEGRVTDEILDPELNLGRLGYTGKDRIPWENVELPEKRNLYLELYSRIINFTNADCKVYIDNEEFNCHLLVLQCYSDLVDAYVSLKKIQVPVEQCSTQSFAFIYEWMITGEPSYRTLNRLNVLEIYIASIYFKIKDLKSQCWCFMDNMNIFNEDTAYLLYMQAKDQEELEEIRELMLPRIQVFFLMLVSSQDWLLLDLKEVKVFLSSNYICINCEMEVFMSAVRWLKYDWPRREVYKYEVLECVRFGNIAPWQLIDMKRNKENVEFIELAKDPKICKMIDDGLAYVIIKFWYTRETSDFQTWNTLLGLVDPLPRNWSGIEKTYFTYRDFLIYLDTYRRSQLIDAGRSHSVSDTASDSRRLHRSSSSRLQSLGDVRVERKKSEIPQPSNTSTEVQVYHSREKRKRRMSRTDAAIKIQRAYRQHCADMMVGREVSMERSITPKRKSKVLSLFMPSKHRNSVSQTDEDEPQLDPLFQKDKETILIFGGTDPHKEYGVEKNTGKDIFRYDADFNTWQCIGELPDPRHYHCVAFFQEKIWIVGGSDPRQDEKAGRVVTNSVWTYDPWYRVWHRQESLLEARKNFGLVPLGKQLFAIGGQGKKFEALKSVEKFSPAKKTWQKASPMIQARTGLTCTLFKKFILVAGGLSGSNRNIIVLDSIETYDLERDQWTELERRLSVPRCFSCMCVLQDKIYVVGGAERRTDGEKVTSSVGTMELWDEENATWTVIEEMSIPRHGHCLGFIGTQMVVIGGVSTTYGRALGITECFCTARGSWIRGMANVPAALSGHAVVTLPALDT